jgi:hypothetical protein
MTNWNSLKSNKVEGSRVENNPEGYTIRWEKKDVCYEWLFYQDGNRALLADVWENIPKFLLVAIFWEIVFVFFPRARTYYLLESSLDKWDNDEPICPDDKSLIIFRIKRFLMNEYDARLIVRKYYAA